MIQNCRLFCSISNRFRDKCKFMFFENVLSQTLVRFALVELFLRKVAIYVFLTVFLCMWYQVFVHFALFLTVSMISATLSFLKMFSCVSYHIWDNGKCQLWSMTMNVVPNLCPFCCISSRFWDKCKFMLFYLFLNRNIFYFFLNGAVLY